jgi:hypothetical protein
VDQLNEDGTKTCPECAEHVQSAALVCRFCGYRFDGAAVAPEETNTSGVAVASFIASLIGLWIAAIPLGIHARRQIDQSGGRKTGRGFATAGIVLGIIGLIASVIVIGVLVSATNHTAQQACVRNTLGATFCGEEAKEYCHTIKSEAGACAAYPSQETEEKDHEQEAEAKTAAEHTPEAEKEKEEAEKAAAPPCKEHETTPADGCKE